MNNARARDYWRVKKSYLGGIKHVLFGRETACFVRHDARVDMEAIRTLRKNEYILLSFEDQPPDILSGGFCDTVPRHLRFQMSRKIKALMLRDAPNTFASLLKSGLLSKSNFEFYRNLWKQYAQLFLKARGADSILAINYNNWVSEEGYRRELANSMGLKFDDTMRYSTAREGGGSSFDKMRYMRNADLMKTSERWKSVSAHPLIKDLLGDQGIALLNKEIFG